MMIDLTMESQFRKIYKLDDRAIAFAQEVKFFVRKLPVDIVNTEYAKQLIRSSSAIGANYIEANDCLGKKDFLMRTKIAKKEARETIYWLKLINSERKEKQILINEAQELMKILGSMIDKKEKK